MAEDQDQLAAQYYDRQHRRGEEALAYLIVGWLMFLSAVLGYVLGRVS